jgi:hypothetical protein
VERGPCDPAGDVYLILSHSMLEYVVNLEDTYLAWALWLKPGGWISHQIDFTSHYLTKDWNGQRTSPDWMWKIIILTTSLSCADQICPRRITVFRAQATKGSGALRPRKPL